MSKSGRSGAAAAAIADALSPAAGRASASQRSESQALFNQNTKTHPGSSAGQVLKTLGGSDAGGGMGVLLPVILIGSLVLATGFGIVRHFGPGASS